MTTRTLHAVRLLALCQSPPFTLAPLPKPPRSWRKRQRFAAAHRRRLARARELQSVAAYVRHYLVNRPNAKRV